jgi:amino acid adenylation domain-containing protein
MSGDETLDRVRDRDGAMDEGRALLARLRDGAPHAAKPAEGTPRFSATQSALLVAHDLHPGQPVSNVGRSWDLTGPLDIPALERALARLVERHDALRMSVRHEGGPAMPHFAERLSVELHAEHLASASEVSEAVRAHVLTPIPLEADRLWSVRLFRIASDRHVLSVVKHHLVTDERSGHIFIRDLMVLYDAEVDGTSPALPQAGSYRAALIGSRPVSTEAAETLPEPDWPGQHAVAGTPDALLCETGEDALDAGALDALKAVARVHNTTPFLFCVAAFECLLSAHCDQQRFGLSVSAWDRGTPEAEQAIGAYIRDFQLGADLCEPRKFSDLLQAASGALRAAQGRQADVITPGRAAIGYYNAPRAPITSRHLTITQRPKTQKAQSVNLHLSLHPGPDGLSIRLDGQRRYFDAPLLGRMAQCLRLILEQAIADPDIDLSDIALVSDEEIAAQARRGVRPAPDGAETDIPKRFAEVVAAHPEALALATPLRSWSYEALDRDTDALARWMRGQGLAPGQRLAVALPRGTAVVRSWLAALKAGLVVVPVDADLPPERVTRIVGDAGCDALLAPHGAPRRADVAHLSLPEDSALVDIAQDGPLIAPDTDPGRAAFVMFTSGTTGLPKSIPVPHAGLTRLALGSDCLPIGPGDRIMQLASPGFDGSFIEVWGAWLRGAALVLCEKHIFADGGVAGEFRRLRPTAAFLTTSLFNMLVDADASVLGPLKWLAIGGEAASPDHCRRALAAAPGLILSNVYGPTENASLTTRYAVPPTPGPSVPIGRPMAGNATFVLSEHGRPVPDGFAGELFIGGPGLSPGYENRPDARVERFIGIERRRLGLEGAGTIALYRTGDRVRWMAAGNLDYLGRRDSQFKLNGYRVEPSEIEAALNAHPAVSRSVILPVRGDGGTVRGIVAFFEANGPAPVPRSLRGFLAERLPRPILPGRFVALDALPLTPNGKADLAALGRHPVFVDGDETAERSQDDPLTRIWCEVLGLDHVPEDADFHTLGGTSIALVRMILDVEAAFGVEIDFSSFAEDATLRRLRILIAMSPQAKGQQHLREMRAGDPACVPIVTMPSIHGQGMWAVEILDALGGQSPVHALTFDPAEAAEDGGYDRVLDRMVEELSRLEGGAPPIFVGYSFGGTFAAHLAARAAQRGVEIGKIISIDGPSPVHYVVPNPLRADSADALRRQFYLHPAAPLTPDIHLIRATRAFPVVKQDRYMGWVPVSAGNLFHYEMDTYHGCFAKPLIAPRVAARIEAIASGRKAGGARVTPTLDVARIEWSNRVKAALLREDTGGALCAVRDALPSAGPVPDHVAIAMIQVLRKRKQPGAIAAFTKRLGARNGPSVWATLADGAGANGLPFLERAHRAAGPGSGAALPMIEHLADRGELAVVRRLIRALDRQPVCTLEAQLARGMCDALAGNGTAARERFAAALSTAHVAPIHAIWMTHFLGRRGYVSEARALIPTFRKRFPDQAQKLATQLQGRPDSPRPVSSAQPTARDRLNRVLDRLTGRAV